MNSNEPLIQNPAPGKRMVKFCGDTVNFTLSLPYPKNGTAWIRTNIGQAPKIRQEIILEIEKDQTPLGRAWFDIPMTQIDERKFSVTLPLCENGHFEAKCFFLQKADRTPIWPLGPNTVINVDAAEACCGNIIYNAFVRQFGPNKAGGESVTSSEEETISNLDKRGYTVIPPSGTFRDLIKELDFILGELGCRILLLLPIHPTPTTYGRMGRFGSPYAALSFTAVDPALAQFDPHATPLEQFIELADAVHQRHARVFIDIAINHTGWAAGLHESHPQWLVRGPEGKIEVPGAWGVNWEDLTKLDYSQKDLWRYMANVFLTWCNRGVDGFRCDAGYMIPVEAWKYMVAKVRDQYPNTVFLLEGLGGKISVTRDLLNTANLSWAYSELFQNYDRGQIEAYLPEAIDISMSDGIAVHFAETHDNPRLASRSKVYARMRTALCALLSTQGGYGFANGVEWYAAEKINVHKSCSLNWGAADNQVDHIRRLNQLLKTHPAFYSETELKMIQEGDGSHIVLWRHHVPTNRSLLVVVNLDDKNKTFATWNSKQTGMIPENFVDLLSGTTVSISKSNKNYGCPLDPGQVLCLAFDKNDVEVSHQQSQQTLRQPRHIANQRLRAKVLEVFTFYRGTVDLADFNIDLAAQRLQEDPIAFCKSLSSTSQESSVITWMWPRDLRREVMVPPGYFLIVLADCAFRVRLLDGQQVLGSEDSHERGDGLHFGLFAPLPTPEVARSYILKISVYSSNETHHGETPLMLLPQTENLRIKRIFQRPDLQRNNFMFLNTNGRGAMLRTPVRWGELTSRYDSLLAGNISSKFPEDRRIMFTRCRAWLVYQGYSQALVTDCLKAFAVDHQSGGYWRFNLPSGQGEQVGLTMGVKMIAGENTIHLTFHRQPAEEDFGLLDDHKLVQLILRPDIENRSFHETTKAYMGPEEQWRNRINYSQQEFQFTPDPDHNLRMQISDGDFIWEPEWHYMVHRGIDAERGLDPNSDLFSPGYFKVFLEGNQEVTLAAKINAPTDSDTLSRTPRSQLPVKFFETDQFAWGNPLDILTNALDDFIVSRGELKSVIAGFPWFLDWGRDALIFARGLIAAQKIAEARAILKQFGQFEQQGTLPNMIKGNDAGNRDTSDAPLWFVLACDDLLRSENASDLLDMDCKGRSVRQIILSIVESIMTGTPNGIRMDPATGLVFSPAHFTWMDTDHPAGSPRQGYPIEIQALWFVALSLLARVDRFENQGRWRKLINKVQSFITKLFWNENKEYLSDCLHASQGQPATEATPDDALRPNQLFAITLGVIDNSQICRRILAACEELLIPGAIRSLADRPVEYPIEIIHNGIIINDGHNPYQGKYIGDEDTRRKPAYHNGTAWTWPFPSFCEAWVATYGPKSKPAALAWLSSGIRLLEQGCLGHIPEILDGDVPHTPRGCDAQAWGASELLRVWLKLTTDH